jgi:hypothetical protein
VLLQEFLIIDNCADGAKIRIYKQDLQMWFADGTSGEMDSPARWFSKAVKVAQHPGFVYFDTLVILYAHFQDDIHFEKLQKTQPCHEYGRVVGIILHYIPGYWLLKLRSELNSQRIVVGTGTKAIN